MTTETKSLFPFLSFDLPDKLLAHVRAWLTSNQRQPEGIRWSLFPLGMVNGWITRAEESEAVIAYVHGLIEHGEWCLDNCTCKHYVGMRESAEADSASATVERHSAARQGRDVNNVPT